MVPSLVKMNSKALIIPSIIARSFSGVREKITLAERFAPWVQLDIADGVFAGPETWDNPDDLRDFKSTLKKEVHLMVQEPERVLREWMDVADRVYIHYEAIQQTEALMSTFLSSRAELGIALSLETPISVLDPYIEKIQSVQLMSIASLGSYGSPFDECVFEKISILREHYPSVTISVDGGVRLEMVKRLRDAGVSHFVVGSAIFSAENPQQAYEEFEHALSA